MFTIKDKKLKKLDQSIGEFYKLNARYFNSLINKFGRKVFKKEVKQLNSQADSIKPTAEFDQLILRNIKSNLRIQETVIDYFTDPKFHLTPPKFIDAIAGRGSWMMLEKRFINSPWEMRWHHTEQSLERGQLLANEKTDEAQKLAKKWIPQIKKDILSYGIDQSYLPADFDFQLYLLPPKDDGQYSRWNSKAKVFELGNYGFDFFHTDKSIIVMPTIAYRTSFHEIIGHAAHQSNSANMPCSVSFSEEIASLTGVKTTVEGVSDHASKQSWDYIRQNLSRLKIRQEEYDFQFNLEEILTANQYEYLFLSLLKDRETREKGFKGYKYIQQITKNPMLARYFKHDFDSEFYDEWGSFGHTFGPDHFALMVNKLTRKFGRKYLEQNHNRFNRAHLTGVWSWEVYPEAVCWIMENLP